MPENRPSPPSPQPRRAAAAAWAGTSIEYYDFFIYGTASALVFGDVFFPTASSVTATLASLSTYSIAFFARPLGGLLFGHLGDRIGRKRNLIITLLTIGIATFLVGCLPTYASIGAAAPVLLVILRFLQGIAIGGEWGGATLMSVEHAPEGKRGFYGTFVQLGSPTGSLLASLVFYLLSLSGDGNLTGGTWRIPFLASAVLVLICLAIRLGVPESPEFAKAAQKKDVSRRPLHELWAGHRRRLLLAVGALTLGTGGFFVVSVYLLLVYAPTVGVPESTALLAGVAYNIVSLLTFGLYGKLGDRYGARRVSLLGCAYTVLMTIPMFAMVATGSTALVLLAVPLCYAGSNAVFALNSSLISQIFPTRLRYTGISVAFQTSAMLTAAAAPFFATWLQELTGGSYWPMALYLIALAVTSAVCIAKLTAPRDTPAPPSGPAPARTPRAVREPFH